MVAGPQCLPLHCFVHDLIKPSCLQIISVPALKRFLANVQSQDVTAAWVEGGMHELFLGRFEAESRTPTVQWLQQNT